MSGKNVKKITGNKAQVKTKKKAKKTVTEGKIYITAGLNNTLISITDLNGNVIASSSAGLKGFKGAKKATPYAASVAMSDAINKAKVFGFSSADVIISGVGAGREQAVRTILANNVKIKSLTDRTPIPHNGCRRKKARRV